MPLTFEEILQILSPEQQKEVRKRIADGERFQDFVEVQARLFDKNTDISVLTKKGNKKKK